MTVIVWKKLEFLNVGHRRAIGLGLFLVLLFWIQFAEGQRRRDVPVFRGSADAGAMKNSSTPGKSVMFDQTKLRPGDVSSFETFRRSIVNSALSYDLPPDLSGGAENAPRKKADEEKELSFPSFPRVWTERSMEDYSGVSAYASATIPIPFVTGTTYGLKLNKNYRYSVKTTFVLVASDSSDHSKKSDQPKVRQADSEDEDKILRFDHSTMHAYPRVSDEIQMVGLCSYDISLSNEFQTQNGFSLSASLGKLAAGFGITHEKGIVEVAKTTRFSKFIKLDGAVSIDEYLRIVCMDEFNESKKKEIESHFNKIVLEMMWHRNPNSTCKPSLGNSEESLPNGDRSCMGWYADSFDSTLRKRTIPRCEIQADGAHRCVLKSRENASCPMFLDRKSGTYSPFLSRETRRLSVTSGAYERPCDEKSGLKCQFVDKPSMFGFGIPLIMGSARCSR
jgi:hypothetical protein